MDQNQHGEVGFDLGLAMERVPETAARTSRGRRRQPPNGQQQFTIAVEAPAKGKLMHVWSEMCQAGSKPPPEFRAIYPFVTTVPRRPFPLPRRRCAEAMRDSWNACSATGWRRRRATG